MVVWILLLITLLGVDTDFGFSDIRLNPRFNVIDFSTAAGILCLLRGRSFVPGGGFEFLEDHMTD